MQTPYEGTLDIVLIENLLDIFNSLQACTQCVFVRWGMGPWARTEGADAPPFRKTISNACSFHKNLCLAPNFATIKVFGRFASPPPCKILVIRTPLRKLAYGPEHFCNEK